MQSYNCKRNLIDTDLLNYYHINKTHFYTTRNMHYSDYTKLLEVYRTWPSMARCSTSVEKYLAQPTGNFWSTWHLQIRRPVARHYI